MLLTFAHYELVGKDITGMPACHGFGFAQLKGQYALQFTCFSFFLFLLLLFLIFFFHELHNNIESNRVVHIKPKQ